MRWILSWGGETITECVQIPGAKSVQTAELTGVWDYKYVRLHLIISSFAYFVCCSLLYIRHLLNADNYRVVLHLILLSVNQMLAVFCLYILRFVSFMDKQLAEVSVWKCSAHKWVILPDHFHSEWQYSRFDIAMSAPIPNLFQIILSDIARSVPIPNLFQIILSDIARNASIPNLFQIILYDIARSVPIPNLFQIILSDIARSVPIPNLFQIILSDIARSASIPNLFQIILSDIAVSVPIPNVSNNTVWYCSECSYSKSVSNNIACNCTTPLFLTQKLAKVSITVGNIAVLVQLLPVYGCLYRWDLSCDRHLEFS